MNYEENKHGAFVPQIRVDSTVQVPAPTEQGDTWHCPFVTQIDDVLDDGTAILTDEHGDMHQIKISRLKLSVSEQIFTEAKERFPETLDNLNDEDTETVFLNAVRQMENALTNLENSHGQVDPIVYDTYDDISNMRFYFNNILIKLDKHSKHI